ncbi:MAG: serine/threonine-protein phosphatase [Aliivibrio sp.]|uniref:PP2C family protein-serine/threonine phosphatase n=1 Tax=Aliivibrio sp. TaxID=1872443 RepID=UPI001A3F292A|nr:serine/threonine-protein phosphatase [Aliivibrio sp.]
MIIFSSASFTHQGKVRVKNEDAILSLSTEGIWVVADGMGGYEYGELASRMITEGLRDEKFSSTLEQRIRVAKARLQQINYHLSQEKTLSQSSIIGSTVCLLISYKSHMACVWAGDSRCYLYRQKKLYQISKDHTTETNAGKEALTQAIGMGNSLDIEHCIFAVHNNDTLLLTSDGVHKSIGSDVIQSGMAHLNTAKGSQYLQQMTLQTDATDNLSAVMIKVSQ